MPSTKQLKIGLSNADKTAMATQVLNKVINGPITIDDEETSLTEKIGEINEAVGEVNDKANVDGNYPTMTVGNADQLNSTVYVVDKVPYLYRTSGGDADIGNREYDKIIGGSLVVNQLLNRITNGVADHGITLTIGSNGEMILTGTNDGTVSQFNVSYNTISVIVGHKYLIFGCPKGGSETTYRLWVNSSSAFPLGQRLFDIGNGRIREAQATETIGSIIIQIFEGTDVNLIYYPNMFDLTQMLGSTIADYIYSLEQANAGSGVAWFRNYFKELYYPYNNGAIKNVKLVSHNMIGFNQWDEEWEVGRYNTTTGAKQNISDRIRSKNPIRVAGSTTYYVSVNTSTTNLSKIIYFYDINNNYLSYYEIGQTNGSFTTPANCSYITFNMGSGYGTTYNNDICINLSWSGWRNGQYEKYQKNSYPLDSTIELRGIPKLDSDNHLYFDGDEYSSDGKVVRKYGSYTFTGNESWSMDGSFADVSLTNLVNWKQGGKYLLTNGIVCYLFGTNNLRVYYSDNPQITSSTDMNSVFPNGTVMNYELATSTEESATPFQEPQIVDDFGTEEYVVPTQDGWQIPVGHDTKYPANLRDKLQRLPDMPSVSQNVTETYVVNYNGTTKKCTFVDIDTWLGSNGYKKASELPTIDAVGGTLRQLLSIKESLDFDNTAFLDLGSLSWENYLGVNGVFRATISGAKGSASATDLAKALCSKYAIDTIQNVSSSINNKKIAINVDGTRVYVFDTTYSTNATTFKADMKGVLLAYEKA